MSGYCPEHGAYTTRRYETGCPVCSPDAENTRLRERIEKLEAECEFVKAQKESLQRTAEFAVSLHEGRMYYFDAQKAMEHSERLHELLAEWRKGQKERKW